MSHQLLCFNEVPEAALHKFWDLESIGISDAPVEDADVSTVFKQQIKYVDGRYEVGFPWKPGMADTLQDNEKLARVRLDSLCRKLDKDTDLQCRYNSVLQEMENDGIIEEVPGDQKVSPHPATFYMPHRPVVKESSSTTKVRPVFDASAAGRNGVSLNDCMEAGPNLMPNLPEILIRFRRRKIALTADITKAFLQVKISDSDRDVSRFLWKLDGTVRVMRFTRVPFGNKSSPFLLNATIKHHLETYPKTKVVTELLQNLYVDDWLTGADSDAEGCDMIQEADVIMKKAGMSLSKWSSSSPVVAEMLQHQFHDKYLTAESVKVLGMRWSAQLDSFSFDCVSIPDGLIVTKRVVLSFIARLFDPLGFVTPFIMLAKCLFQEIWKQGLTWDQPIPESMQLLFLRWLDGMKQMKLWQVPRSYTGCAWCDNEKITLHAFGDASEKGYGACVYLAVRFNDGSMTSSLVISKARVAPLKKVTLPRLELLGALLCARLLTFVMSSLHLSSEVDYRCWIDSMVALAWIQSDAHRWKQFVANRVIQIQELTGREHWAHCPGKENPADLVTRGLFAEQLVASEMWLKGPKFIRNGSGNLEIITETAGVEQNVLVDEQLSLVAVTLVTSGSPRESVFQVDRWSSFVKTIRIVAWVMRFIYNSRKAKSHRKHGELSYEELTQAKHQLIVNVQQLEYGEEISSLRRGLPIPKTSSIAKLSPFLSQEGLLRVGGRIQFAKLSFEEKHPIILPKSHVSMLLVRSHHRMMKHAGVATMISTLRCQFWIVGLRRMAKKVKRECIACQKQDAVACAQPRAPLPGDRVTRSPPFSVTGIDHAGPLYGSDHPGRKLYVLLFTCAVTRALHLELVDSMSLADTMLALRRFVARRGLPSIMYSDNAKSFVAAQGKMISEYGHLSPQWKFIAPRSPWWGGWWERLVKSVKSSLRKSLGSKVLSRSELETTLHEVEACLNSRPLTFVGDEVDCEVPLTPAHFLGSQPVGTQISGVGEHPVTAKDLVVRHKVRSQLLDHFWDIWSSDYIRNLPACKGDTARGHLCVGSVVLVREGSYVRMQWPIGVITKVYPGRDGIIRAVEVKTAKGTYVRSIQLLHDLEITASSECDEETPLTVSDTDGSNVVQSSESQYVTRYGRSVKPVKKLNL